MIEEVKNNILKPLNDRIFSNPVYFIFIVSWGVVHWRFWVTLFFVSSESVERNYLVTKDIYLKSILFDTSIWWISLPIFLLPFFITWFVLYVIQPYLMPTLLRKHEKYENEKRKIEKNILKEQEEVLKKEGEVLEKQKENIGLKKDNIQTESSLKNKENNNLNKAYSEFSKSRYYPQINNLKNCIFLYGGSIKVPGEYYGSQDLFSLDRDFLAYLILNKVVKYSKDKVNIIELTEIGEYILKKYMDNAK